MSRVTVLKLFAAVGIAAALAACDAPSSALAPGARDFAPSVQRAVLDSTSTTPKATATTTMDEPTCRSGYQIAYRDDGTWYCEPTGGI